jgi:hypothetical protein
MYREFVDSREGFDAAEYEYYMNDRFMDDEAWEDEYDDVSEHDDDSHDGQPDEYTEWQDYMGGDDWDHGQYDNDY